MKATAAIFSLIFSILFLSSASAGTFGAPEKKRHYDAYLLKTSLKGEEIHGLIEAKVYRPTKAEIKAILILTPTIAGVSPIETLNAQYFVKAGYLVIMPLPYISEIDSEKPDVKLLEQEFNKPALAAEQFLNEVENQFQLEKTLPVFALGASQGGFRTFGIATSLSRITASWFATAGGDFASIYAHSSVKKIAAFRSRHMRAVGLTSIDDYENYLRVNLVSDPVHSCNKITTPFVQVIALKDDKVPTKNQELLAKACPAHKIIRLNSGHLTASFSTWLWREKVKDFFESNIH